MEVVRCATEIKGVFVLRAFLEPSRYWVIPFIALTINALKYLVITFTDANIVYQIIF
jgi:hypothetical protein